MSVLAAIQQAAPFIGIQGVPDVVFGSTEQTAITLQGVANEAALGIAEDFDWQRLKTLATINGNGSATDWNLPAGYARMLKKARLWPSSQPNASLEHVEDTDEWLRRDVQNGGDVLGRWTIYGNQLHIKPAIPSGSNVQFFYVKNTIIAGVGSSTLNKTRFDTDTDEFFLGDRILKLAIIWRHKQARGRPYAEEFANYNTALDILAGGDKGSRIVHVGRPRMPRDVTIAYPGVLGP